MPNLIRPGQGFLYMKVGTHAKETLEDIIRRKTKEIDQAGFAMWGYGGNTCHPQTMVQPFARECAEVGDKIYLCMEEMNSMHFAEPLRAQEYSVDGRNWQTIDPNINVLGSRYALVIKNLRKEEFDLRLGQATVAIGNSMGASGEKYIKGRVDKACLRLRDGDAALDDGVMKHIGLVAEMHDPYAVYLRTLA